MTFKIGALILAAGQSSRFHDGNGAYRNKLLEPVAGKAIIRHAAEAALASPLDPVIVVTGNESAKNPRRRWRTCLSCFAIIQIIQRV